MALCVPQLSLLGLKSLLHHREFAVKKALATTRRIERVARIVQLVTLSFSITVLPSLRDAKPTLSLHSTSPHFSILSRTNAL
jgi:hypothetical protein